MNDLPFSEESVTLKPIGRHCHLHQVTLLSSSDHHNNPVRTMTYVPRLDQMQPVSGKLFFVISAVDQRALVILSESPVLADAQVKLNANGEITIWPNGYPVAVEECALKDVDRVVRKHFASKCPLRLFSMLNNWGDGSHGKNITQAFYEKEIDAAGEIGLDVVQIDDGWQVGKSADVRIFREDGTFTGYRNFGEDFWSIDQEKFPNGFAPLVERARRKGISMGLWFAPDSKAHFANWAHDVEVLRRAYDWGFRYFKLDMIVIHDAADRDGFIRFLDAVRAFGEDVFLQLDVTGGFPRLGFTDGVNYGKIFVENRYSYYSNDYNPYLTLRNLWQLAQYMPAQRFQFEIPNTHRFEAVYDADDPLAPNRYPVCWLFASIMVASPLFWMEAQHYAAEDRAALQPLMTVWKAHRQALSACDVIPVGQTPDGTSVTGFYCHGDCCDYAVLLSELHEQGEIVIDLLEDRSSFEILSASQAVQVQLEARRLRVCLPDPMQYVFLRIQ